MQVVGVLIPGQLKIITANMLVIIPNIAKKVISTPRMMKIINSSSSFNLGWYMKYEEQFSGNFSIFNDSGATVTREIVS
jgi:hypothetical protein